VSILRPLRERDFALLWTGMTVSLLGDGIYFVAIAFQVYNLSNAPTALSLVGLSWSIGMLAFVLTGGLTSDRFERRLVMIAADAMRAVVLAVIGVLSVTGSLELWHLVVLVVVYGAADAFFGPAFGAIVPDIVPAPLLVEANALDQFVRPIALRLIGPAVGGALVAGVGAGPAFLVDAGTFCFSMLCVACIGARSRAALAAAPRGSALAEIREGLAFVRENTWLWATMVSAAIALLVFYGPVQVLVPFRIKNDLGGDAGDFGLFLAAEGLGSVLASLWMARRGMPARPVTFMYVTWAIGLAPIAGYALASSSWELMALSFVFGVAIVLGMVVWMTLMQTRVPEELRGRVLSFDWFVSIGLTPVSFALTAPVAHWAGAEATLIGAGVMGSLSLVALLLLVPGLRERGVVPQTSAAMSSMKRG
jgi:DHA3 family tetracycline resistance protein-like MFS transporter